HVQGGEVTGNIDEKVRHAITKLSDVHFVSSENAKQRVIKMGEDPATVYNTGCPSIDLANEVLLSPSLNFDPIEKYHGVGGLKKMPEKYIVVLQHPVTTEYDESRQHIEDTLNAVKELKIPTFWFWPNVDAGSDGTSKGIRSFRENNPDLPIQFFKNMEGEDFLRLLKNSSCLIGNSSVGIRECSWLGVPVINIGSRQQGRDRGRNVIDSDYGKDQIKAAIHKQMSNGHYESDSIYGGGNAGENIASHLYTHKLSILKKLAY
nr:UDP-N-acetylglucosamine 2-epimerase (hydrolyzing) [Chitinophagaceae bacterium]